MNAPTLCNYTGHRADALLTYLYGERDASEPGFDAHLAACAVCRAELDALRGVRGRLSAWAPPEPVGALARRAEPQPPPRGRWWALGEIPAWAQLAAASLIVGVSVGIANISVRYGDSGLTIRSGWWPDQQTAEAAPSAETSEPWRAEIAALRAELQSELSAAQAAAPPAVAAVRSETQAAQDDMMRQVRALITESERSHQRELALRVGEALRDVNVQRRADLVNIDRSIGTLQNNLGMEMLKQREQWNNYALRVSSQK